MTITMPVEDPRAQLVTDLLDKHRLSMRWLAAKVNESHVSVTRWLTKTPPKDRQKYSYMLQCIRKYESDISGKVEPVLAVRQMIQLPVLSDLPASPMNTSFADPETMLVPDPGTGEEIYLRRVSGHSMSPLIEAGDVVMFAVRSAEPRQVVQAFDDGKETIKVYVPRRSDGGMLEPVNPDYDPIPLATMNIKGVAIAILRDIPGGRATFEYPRGIFFRPNS